MKYTRVCWDFWDFKFKILIRTAYRSTFYITEWTGLIKKKYYDYVKYKLHSPFKILWLTSAIFIFFIAQQVSWWSNHPDWSGSFSTVTTALSLIFRVCYTLPKFLRWEISLVTKKRRKKETSLNNIGATTYT